MDKIVIKCFVVAVIENPCFSNTDLRNTILRISTLKLKVIFKNLSKYGWWKLIHRPISPQTG